METLTYKTFSPTGGAYTLSSCAVTFGKSTPSSEKQESTAQDTFGNSAPESTKAFGYSRQNFPAGKPDNSVSPLVSKRPMGELGRLTTALVGTSTAGAIIVGLISSNHVSGAGIGALAGLSLAAYALGR